MIKTVEREEIENQYEYMKKIKDIDIQRKYYINTMGCKLNENDSEKISGMLSQMGYEEVDSPENANIVVFNTCCIRENAEEKVFGKLGELKNIKEKKDFSRFVKKKLHHNNSLQINKNSTFANVSI